MKSKFEMNAGQLVFHKKFGYGRVEKIEGTWTTIKFHVGRKRVFVLESLFVPVEKVDSYLNSTSIRRLEEIAKRNIKRNVDEILEELAGQEAKLAA